MNISSKSIETFHQKIFSWYAIHGRDLPWRRTQDPYQILVSEIMLHQTQVDRVKGYWARFLETAPDLEILAWLDKVILLKLWSWLGYNNRVIRLQKTAQQILSEFGGVFPQDKKNLLSLPWVGLYTAHAVMAFARNLDVPVMDTNIRRVLIHEFKLDHQIKEKELLLIAEQCVPVGRSRIWHNALMDYGALEATAAKTGIASLSKQSVFFGSTRWVRSTIVKYCLQHGSISLEKAKTLTLDHEKFDQVIEKMKKESLISSEEWVISLKN